MYHIHTTKALVLQSVPIGERNSMVTLFTRDFGVIRAHAQSVRSLSSKLRYALQEYSFADVSLVRGKEVWRITNARPLYNVYFELNTTPWLLAPFVRIVSLVKRLLPEEGCEALVFDDLYQICANARAGKYENAAAHTLEWLFVLRMLSSLGYVDARSFADVCAGPVEWSPAFLAAMTFQKDDALASINHALASSQL